MTPEEAIQILAQAIMLKTQGNGQEHSVFNQALNVLDKAIKPENKPVKEVK